MSQNELFHLFDRIGCINICLVLFFCFMSKIKIFAFEFSSVKEDNLLQFCLWERKCSLRINHRIENYHAI